MYAQPPNKGKIMHAQNSIALNQVNPLSCNNIVVPQIWDRTFAKDIRSLGRDSGRFVDVYKKLKSVLGNSYDYVAKVIELSRRFGYGFHFSDDQMLAEMPGVMSLRTLSRRKKENEDIVHVGHGCKNRSFYYLNKAWFKNIIEELLIESGILQRQNGVSHIISNDPLGSDLISQSYLEDEDFITTKAARAETLKAVQEYEQLQEADAKAKLRIIKTTEQKIMRNNTTENLGDIMIRSQENLQMAHPAFLSPIERKVRDFNPDQRAVFDKLRAMKVYSRLAAKWVNAYSVAQLNNLIEATKLYCTTGKYYAYMVESVKNLELETEVKPYIPEICYKPWEPGAVMSKSKPNVGAKWLGKIKGQIK